MSLLFPVLVTTKACCTVSPGAGSVCAESGVTDTPTRGAIPKVLGLDGTGGCGVPCGFL